MVVESISLIFFYLLKITKEFHLDLFSLYFYSQDDKEALLLKLKELELLKVEPMYPVEFVSMVEKGKLVKLHKVENLNVQVTLKVFTIGRDNFFDVHIFFKN